MNAERARKAGMIGGGIAVALAVALGGTFAVTQALAIDDEAGSAIDVSPLVVGTSPDHPPLVALAKDTRDEHAAAPVTEVVAPPAVEVVTAPEPRRAPPVVAPPPAQPVAPPVVQAPPPERPAQPQRPSASDVKRWLETGAIDEALAWAKAHGWTEESLRGAMREYAPNYEWKR